MKTKVGLSHEPKRRLPWLVYWFDPPNDIHRQQGISEAAWELILVGKDFSIIPRLYFDPERNTVQEMAATR